MQWTSHCVPWQIDFVGVLFGLWPRFLLFLVFCCLLRCFRWRNASLAGGFAGRRVWLVSVVFVCFFNRFACSNGHVMSLYKRLSYSLCSCKDRAFSATSATLEGKKNSCIGSCSLCSGAVDSMSACWLTAASSIAGKLASNVRKGGDPHCKMAAWSHTRRHSKTVLFHYSSKC